MNARDESGKAALMIATENHQKPIATLLIDEGANIDCLGIRGNIDAQSGLLHEFKSSFFIQSKSAIEKQSSRECFNKCVNDYNHVS